MNQPQAYTLSQLNRRISGVLAADPYLQNVWITGETADVRISGGHCYLELIEKDPDTGRQLAKARATIWANTYRDIAARFIAATGQQFRSDLKVMICVAVTFHPLYGLSLNITAINPAYTLGDAMQRRQQMIDQLKREGIIDMNRTLPWPAVPQRIAVVSARGAAGYGDFVNQLFSNPYRLRFSMRLFPALMQGERTASSVIAALDQIAADADNWDCVVIIRGGGATSELAAFDHYDLAAHIAQFPIPVIIGIGHERDITLLDYVANMRVKTPTAAAEWLIGRGTQALANLQSIGAAMLQAITDRMSGCHRQLSYYQGQLPAVANGAVMRAHKRLLNAQMQLATIGQRRLQPGLARLDNLAALIGQAAQLAVARHHERLRALAALLDALSPDATLRRGYTITLHDGHAVTDPASLPPGALLTTRFASSELRSRVESRE